MATDYRVDLVGLAKLIDDTATLKSSIEQNITEIDQRISDLHVTWTGDAADAHKTAHDNRIRAVADMNEALATLRQKLADALTAYQTVGPTNHGMWPQ
ncbi:WXG100 family type VII secretion target [Nocardia sp. CA2R105]|uniref:WXG100 family type VII secretion target n=1 Tax=Nocardia coffeae TaxID=2873381 RepID=UPI001CA6F7BD|nr:WXG100 family type VII secretion target [Nocardia coffeae]MBY8859883.1 WXG100 family type VII secretion target [Nocardia coffeae]